MSEAKAFLSYRRDDSEGQTGRLYDRLNAAWPGRIFMDVSGISLGVDFIKEIERAMDASAVVLPVIGRQWISIQDKQGRRRLDQAEDPVRFELETALRQDKRIIPVLVNGASMPTAEELPEPLRPIRRRNALELTAGDYDHDVERLIDSLTQSLGPPKQEGPAPVDERATQFRSLRQRGETAIAVEDWMTAIQSLQAALSLNPNDVDTASRLRWAHEQHRLAMVFAEGQRLYQSGQKAAALERFREVRVSGGNYKEVDRLIEMLEKETAPAPVKRGGPLRWVMGTLAAVFLILLVIGLVNREESEGGAGATPVQPPVNGTGPATSVTPAGVGGTTPAAPVEEPPASEQPFFSPVGRWHLTAQANPAWGMILVLNPNGTFTVQTIAGAFSAPGSAGNYRYNGATRTITVSGVNNMGLPFQEAIQILEKHEDHYHVFYAGYRWDMFPE